jgi:hypothetical protein
LLVLDTRLRGLQVPNSRLALNFPCSLGIPQTLFFVSNLPISYDLIDLIDLITTTASRTIHFTLHGKFGVIYESKHKAITTISSHDSILLLDNTFHDNLIELAPLPLHGTKINNKNVFGAFIFSLCKLSRIFSLSLSTFFRQKKVKALDGLHQSI